MQLEAPDDSLRLLLANAWGGRLPQPPQPPSRRVEVIGASVSNGFGNRGHHEGRLGAPASHAMPPREASDPSQAFGPILGRLLQAECRVIAYE
ncbi:hypothetical protein WJX84_001844 [Apatococcus fuscideae]|uniref:Uncharacterized protein n=1 Tax=Apatococcus fuscideae TaxID=2026836 RepID=A0AAW1TB22_9CHLO